METKVLVPTHENIQYVANLLADGDVCGIPTETVYGLAANALSEDAVKKIFTVKGRPQDNPLIVHICSLDTLDTLAVDIPHNARKLAENFWPGPLTIILKKSDKLSATVTAGLDTVAIRYPSHPVAQQLIAAAGVPLAAPSANLSGSPSPTTATHVYSDLKGRISAIIDGGACEVGLESTVVKFDDDGVTLLRPGAITIDMLQDVVNNVTVADGVLNQIDEKETVLSPGLKHTHYSPKTKMVIVDAPLAQFASFVNAQTDQIVGALVFEGDEVHINIPSISYGNERDSTIQAKLLFSALREVDELNADIVYARMPSQKGLGLGVYNRLLRACGFEVITLTT